MLVLCYGVPLKIAPDPDLNEPSPKMPGRNCDRNEAAVDSELAWLPLVEQELSAHRSVAELGLRRHQHRDVQSDQRHPARRAAGRADAEIARGLVDKALEAERDGLWGRAYFDARGLGKTNNYYLGDEWILGAAPKSAANWDLKPPWTTSRKLFPPDFPMSQIAIYCGWYDGDASGPFALPKVEFMPGAFAYHLHSFSASTLRSDDSKLVRPAARQGRDLHHGLRV